MTSPCSVFFATPVHRLPFTVYKVPQAQRQGTLLRSSCRLKLGLAPRRPKAGGPSLDHLGRLRAAPSRGLTRRKGMPPWSFRLTSNVSRLTVFTIHDSRVTILEFPGFPDACRLSPDALIFY